METEMPYNSTVFRIQLTVLPVNSYIIKLKERSQSSVALLSDTAMTLFVPKMLQHNFMENINDRYTP